MATSSKDGKYSDATTELAPIVQRLIDPEQSSDFSPFLEELRYRYLFCHKEIKIGGVIWPYRVTLLKGRNELMTESDVVIEVQSSYWDAFDAKQREALLYEALSRIEVVENTDTGAVRYRIKPPEVVLCTASIKKYGWWSPMHEEAQRLLGQVPADSPAQTKPAPQTKAATKPQPEPLQLGDNDELQADEELDLEELDEVLAAN